MTPPSTVDELTKRNVETIAKIEQQSIAQRRPGEIVADNFAALIGSWRFIIIQTVVLAVWVATNILAWIHHWDPYPFVMLNLALSLQAAYTGPILLMSQNQQGRLSERRSHLDLQINLLSEQENTEMLTLLRRLCEKHGISDEPGSTGAVFEQATEAHVLVDQIERSVEISAGDL